MVSLCEAQPRVIPPLRRVRSAQSHEKQRKTTPDRIGSVGNSKVILLKTAFFREAAGDSSRSPRKERRDAGCYHRRAMSRKTGQVDRLETARAVVASRPADCQAGGRFPQRGSLPDAHVGL